MTTKTATQTKSKLRVGLVVPHIFMHREILPRVIFSPGALAFDLVNGLRRAGADITLFSPGPVDTVAQNVTADLSFFEHELAARGDSYTDLLRKHPFTFITLARQVQSELIAKAYAMANAGGLDIVHIYTNEEDTALPFAQLCTKPVVFTHHDPFNFMVKYKNVFPKYKSLNWISMSYAQRAGMPPDTNWVGNIYHGLPADSLTPVENPTDDYLAYVGRIIQPKGLHLAVDAVKLYNAAAKKSINLKIAGKHYAGHKKDTYWQEQIVPRLNDANIEYVGFLGSEAKRGFIANARAVVLPSIFEEPFGMVAIEALACGTPIIALNSGALPEIVRDNETGIMVKKALANDGKLDEPLTAEALADAITHIDNTSRTTCRQDFNTRFTLERMCAEHMAVYQKLIG